MFEFFGAGSVFIAPVGGNQPANPSAMSILGIQGASVSADQKMVELKGANKGPDDVATADMTIKGNIEMARVDVDVFNQAYYSEAMTTNAPIVVPNESGTIPGTPFAITVAGSATWVKDLGVRNSNGQPFVKVASGPVAGEYSVAAGVYTFAAADTGKSVLISYTKSSTAGTLLTVHNQLMGFGPIVEVYMWENYSTLLNQSTNNGLHLFAVRFAKLDLTIKRDNFAMVKMEFEGFPNPNIAGNPWFEFIDGAGTGI